MVSSLRKNIWNENKKVLPLLGYLSARRRGCGARQRNWWLPAEPSKWTCFQKFHRPQPYSGHNGFSWCMGSIYQQRLRDATCIRTSWNPFLAGKEGGAQESSQAGAAAEGRRCDQSRGTTQAGGAGAERYGTKKTSITNDKTCNYMWFFRN